MAEQQHEALDSSELEFLVCALDLISGLVEGLRGSSEQLIGQSNLLNLLYECCKSSSPDVRQSSFALIGDLARHAINFLRPGLPTLMPILIHNLQLPEFVSACNNACWALGEICLRAPDDVRPFAPAMMTHLVPLINRLQINRGLLENAAITIGRLGLVAPDVVAVNLEDFIQRWCMALRNVRDDSEKDSAFRGLCQLIKTNPRGVIKHFLLVCDAIASWIAPKPDLKEMFYQILHGFKNSVTPQAWADYFNSFPAQLRQALHNQYGL
jgi:transportin-1